MEWLINHNINLYHNSNSCKAHELSLTLTSKYRPKYHKEYALKLNKIRNGLILHKIVWTTTWITLLSKLTWWMLLSLSMIWNRMIIITRTLNYDVTSSYITWSDGILDTVWGGVYCVQAFLKGVRFATVTHACTMVERSFSRSDYGTISGQARGFTAKGEICRENIRSISENIFHVFSAWITPYSSLATLYAKDACAN